MKNIVIFLAASEKALNSERLEIARLVQNLNQIYKRKAKNIKLKLFKTGTDAEFTQENFENSEMIFLISCDELNIQDLECFNAAYERFKVNDTPRIATYFKKSETKTQQVLDFMQELADKNKHYYGEFSAMEELKCKILLNFLTLDDQLELEYKDNNIEVEGEKMGTLKNLDCMTSNEALSILRKELKEIETAYDEAMDINIETNTRKTGKEVNRLYDLMQEKQFQIGEFEKDVFLAMLNLAKSTTEHGLSEKRIQAYKLLEKGDYKKANEILDFSELKNLIKKQQGHLNFIKKNMKETQKKLRQNINALLQKVTVLKLNIQLADRFDQIEEIYQFAMLTEKRGDLEPLATWEYAQYLHDQNRYEAATGIIKELVEYYKKDSVMSCAILNLLGVNYYKNNDPINAMEAYINIIEIGIISEEISDMVMLGCYNNIANIYKDNRKYDKAREIYQRNIEILEKVASENEFDFEEEFCAAYSSLAIVYRQIGEHEEAEAMNKKAIHIFENSTIEKTPEFEEHLAYVYNNLANLYNGAQRYEEAEQMYKKTLEIRENLAEINPQAYEPLLISVYNNLAILYEMTQRYEQAEQLYLKVVSARERLSLAHPAAYEPYLANSYQNIAILYETIERYDEAEKTYKKAIEIREGLASSDTIESVAELAKSYKALAFLYINTKRLTEAEQMFEKVLHSTQSLFDANPEYFADDLASACTNLATIYQDNQKLNQAYDFYVKAVQLNSQLADRNFDEYACDLAQSYINLADLFMKVSKLKDAEVIYTKAVNVYRTMLEKNQDPKTVLMPLGVTLVNLCRINIEIQDINQLEENVNFASSIFDYLESVAPGSSTKHMRFINDIKSQLGWL